MRKRMIGHLLFTVAAAWIVAAVPAHAREVTELRDRLRDGVQRTDKDLGATIHRDKLDDSQKKKLDAAQEDLDRLREAVANGKWQDERSRFERAIENIDFLAKHAPLSDADRQTLGIDVYTLQVILDSWKALAHDPGKR